MSIKPLNHYSIENQPTIFDEEAMTALKLAGRTAAKVNEAVNAFNKLETETNQHLAQQDADIPVQVANKVQEHIDNGDFDQQIDGHTHELVHEMEDLKQTTTDRLDSLLGSVGTGSTSGDAELADIRYGANFKTYSSAGTAIREQFYTLPIPLPAIETAIDFDQYTEPANYVFATSEKHTNGPNIDLPRFLQVECFGERISDLGKIQTWGKQTVYNDGGTNAYTRFFKWDYSTGAFAFYNWQSDTKNTNARVMEGSVDYNTITEPDNYIVAVDDAVNGPWTGTGGLVRVDAIGGWLVQEVHGLPGNDRHFIRTGNKGDDSVSWGEWCETSNKENVNLSFDGVDLNNVVEGRTYVVATENALNKPDIVSGFMLRVTAFGPGWLLQEAFNIYPGTEYFYRTGKNTNDVAINFAPGLQVDWSNWIQVANAEDLENIPTGGGSGSGAPLPNEGYTIVNFGDSIFGAEQGPTSISNHLAQLTGATVINVAFGGCQMTTRDDEWNAFSMCKLASAIMNREWDLQEETVNTGFEGMPSYFPETVERLKAIDWSKVDIITICYGTNDYTAGDYMGEIGGYDVDTVLGALEYSVDNIIAAYPNIRAVIIGPCFRFWDSQYDNSDQREFDAGYNLGTLSDEMQTFAKIKHLPFVNPYYDMGINKYNATKWTDDGTHPNAKGRYQLAKLIAKTLSGM